jgi:hypothetical protein
VLRWSGRRRAAEDSGDLASAHPADLRAASRCPGTSSLRGSARAVRKCRLISRVMAGRPYAARLPPTAGLELLIAHEVDTLGLDGTSGTAGPPVFAATRRSCRCAGVPRVPCGWCRMLGVSTCSGSLNGFPVRSGPRRSRDPPLLHDPHRGGGLISITSYGSTSASLGADTLSSGCTHGRPYGDGADGDRTGRRVCCPAGAGARPRRRAYRRDAGAGLSPGRRGRPGGWLRRAPAYRVFGAAGGRAIGCFGDGVWAGL